MRSPPPPPPVLPSQNKLAVYQPGKYIACVYDNLWYIGNIAQRNDEENDVFVNFMKQDKRNTFSWPSDNKKDECWVPLSDMLCVVEAPDLSHRRQYKLTCDDFQKVNELFLKR